MYSSTWGCTKHRASGLGFRTCFVWVQSFGVQEGIRGLFNDGLLGVWDFHIALIQSETRS